MNIMMQLFDISWTLMTRSLGTLNLGKVAAAPTREGTGSS